MNKHLTSIPSSTNALKHLYSCKLQLHTYNPSTQDDMTPALLLSSPKPQVPSRLGVRSHYQSETWAWSPCRQAKKALCYLVNDSRSRPPEAHTILGTCSCQEIIHFLVDVLLKQINNQSISLIWNDLTLHTPSHTVLTCWHREYNSSLVGLLKIIPKGLAVGL